jgi:DNA-binding transcriptional MerR regulator
MTKRAAEGFGLKDVAGELGVSPSTLKSWTREFEEFLSVDSPSSDGAFRFNDVDVRILKRIKEHLASGLTLEESADQLREDGYADDPAKPDNGGETADGTGDSRALATSPNAAQQGFSALTETLRAMIENQQAIQNSLQVNRNLLGVILQDNFNLKEENAKLRDRMLKMEQELNEFRRRDSDFRVLLEQRMGRVEQNVRTAIQEARRGLLSRLFGG